MRPSGRWLLAQNVCGARPMGISKLDAQTESDDWCAAHCAPIPTQGELGTIQYRRPESRHPFRSAQASPCIRWCLLAAGWLPTPKAESFNELLHTFGSCSEMLLCGQGRWTQNTHLLLLFGFFIFQVIHLDSPIFMCQLGTWHMLCVWKKLLN